jgi:predicted porin
MNKKLMAVAVAGALAVPAVAFAQASSVQIYGRANLGVDSWSATGATAPGGAGDLKNRTRVYDSGSRLGFRGTEDLGGGLRAMFVLESGVNFDTGSTTNQNGVVGANASAGTLASRDSYLGIGGSWGDVRFGRQSIYWVNGLNGQSGANYINNEIGWFNGAGMGRVTFGVARQPNVMSYNSPTWSGFDFAVKYQPTSEGATANAPTDGNVWGVTLNYEGPIGVRYDHAVNQFASPTTPTALTNRQKGTADKLSIGWPYQPGARIAVIFNRTRIDDNAATANYTNVHDNVSQGYWGLNWEHMMGNWQFLAMYSKLNNASGCNFTQTAATSATSGIAVGTNGCDGTQSTGYTLGLKYFFSKRTQIYTSWIAHNNGFNQVADVTGGGYSSGTVAAGADPRIFAVGLWHSF